MVIHKTNVDKTYIAGILIARDIDTDHNDDK